MKKTFFSLIFIALCTSPSLTASAQLLERASHLFPHIKSISTRLDYLNALENIRTDQEIFPDFFEIHNDLSHFRFKAKTKKFSEVDGDGISRMKEGTSIFIPAWVDSACLKNWKALSQLLQHSPVIVEEAYNDDPFCKIVFAAGPPESIIQQIIAISATIIPGLNPFLGAEKDQTLIPFSSLHLETPIEAVALCVEASHKAAHAASLSYLFYDNSARLCARHITANTHSLLITLPEQNPWEHAQDILLWLIKDKKYHGFDNYFAFIIAHNCPPDDFARITSVGIRQLGKTRLEEGSVDISDAAKRFLAMALRHYPDQTIEARATFIKKLFDEYLSDPAIDRARHNAQVAFDSILQHLKDAPIC